VLGVGTKYRDYSSKTDAYWAYLHHGTRSTVEPTAVADGACEDTSTGECQPGLSSHLQDVRSYHQTLSTPPPRAQDSPTATAIPIAPEDDDIVLFMDAYDVLVFPALANAAKMLADSPTPILFCAERGIYPEFQGTVKYHHFRGLCFL
jgi:hypothetical protein